MSDNQSYRKFRGFKYIVLVLLLFGAVGLAYFSFDRSQTEEPIAVYKDKMSDIMGKTSDTIEATRQYGEKMLTKASVAKDSMGDTLNRGKQEISRVGSDVVEKAGQLTDSAKEIIGQWAAPLTSAGDAGDDDGTSSSSDIGRDRSTATSFSDQIKRQASISVTDTKQAIKTGFDSVSHTAAVDKENTGIASQLDHSKQNPSQIADVVQTGVKDGAAKRCVGTPSKGKDLGDHYIVAYCETLGIISKRTGIGVQNLIDRNPQVLNPDLIFPKQRLWLPPRS